MLFLCEIIILYDDIDLPDAGVFCPSYWEAEHFDSDGDFYYYGIESRWTNLELLKFYGDQEQSSFDVNVYREKNRLYEPGILEASDLSRYIDYKNQGRYKYVDSIHQASNLCVASLCVETSRIEDYREFLMAVHTFLAHTHGRTTNLNQYYAADAFMTEVIRPSPSFGT